MTKFADLLQAIASLLWPILAFWALRSFRHEIAQAMGRLKSATILGNKVELIDDLRRLNAEAGQASSEAAGITKDDIPYAAENREPGSSERPETADPVQKILETAINSPRVALLLMADEIEKKAHGVAASIGKGGEDGPLPFPEAIARLDRYYRLPRHVTSSLTLFLDVRKKLVHGGFAKDEDMVSALDSGVTIFRALKSLPRKRIWVIHRKDVPVYSDQECRHEIKKIRGVILKTTGPSTESATYRIFPSTKTEFVEGQRVLGEWDLSRTWPCAWYVDPDSDQVELAWESAGEFVGSHLE